MKPFHPDYLGETARRIKLKQYPDTRQVVVQHLYADTLRLLLLLHKYVPILQVIGIGYSGSPSVVSSLEASGIKVLTPAYENLQDTVNQVLGECLDHCEQNQLQLVIHEVGGYAIKALHDHYQRQISLVSGALEVTKQGVWVAENIPELKIPQLNCAQTRLKQIEGGMVGEAVVSSLDVILRELGYSPVGRQALVLGYGWVGKGTAVSLNQRGLQVSVHDSDVIKCVEATVDGFTVLQSLGEKMNSAIVIGASGSRSINPALLDSLPNRCFIASGASKDHEIDLEYLRKCAVSINSVHPHVEAFELTDGRTLFLVNKGFPVNFTGASVPDEIVEFLFSEMIMLVPLLLDDKPAPGIYPLPAEQETIAAQVWLDLR